MIDGREAPGGYFLFIYIKWSAQALSGGKISLQCFLYLVGHST